MRCYPVTLNFKVNFSFFLLLPLILSQCCMQTFMHSCTFSFIHSFMHLFIKLLGVSDQLIEGPEVVKSAAVHYRQITNLDPFISFIHYFIQSFFHSIIYSSIYWGVSGPTNRDAGAGQVSMPYTVLPSAHQPWNRGCGVHLQPRHRRHSSNAFTSG